MTRKMGAANAIGHAWIAPALVACGVDGPHGARGQHSENAQVPDVAGQTWPLWDGEIDTEHQGVVMVGNGRQPPSCSGTLIAGGGAGGGCAVVGGARGASGTGAAFAHAWLVAGALCLHRRIRRVARRGVDRRNGPR